jgi:hypothetical protein
MIRVTLEFQNEDELISYFMRDKVGCDQPAINIKFRPDEKIIEAEVVVPEVSPEPAITLTAEQPKRRGRPRTKAPEATVQAVPETPSVLPDAPAPQPAAEKKPNAPVSATALPPDQVAVKARQLLMPVFNSKGSAVVTEIMKQFNVTRVDQFTAEQLPDLVKACAL